MLLWFTLALAQTPADLVVHGMTLSTPTYNEAWGSDTVPLTLSVLADDGVNWVSYHPYARIGRDGSVTSDLDVEHPPDWLTRPLREAHARGLQVLIKPHLAHWGSGFSWRGDIAFDDDAARERFFREYTQWMRDLAQLTATADAFCVGTELDGTVQYEAEWRHVIATVRAVFPGQLTYAANWDRYEHVPFWDAVDAIGIQAYFPLLDADEPASVARLERSWQQILLPLHALSERTGKPVVFTELGYDASATALSRPWEGGHGDDATQALALATALRVIDADPVVRGLFLWKWFPGELQRGDFRMSRPEARAVIRDAWTVPASHQP